ncbi:hypothetical protein BC833DRAFT_625423 [Globomyces pollinis-pini]|nr:hypothetical protein BC833DRAFT_625423 [Globomyces pollinis-pini]
MYLDIDQGSIKFTETALKSFWNSNIVQIPLLFTESQYTIDCIYQYGEMASQLNTEQFLFSCRTYTKMAMKGCPKIYPQLKQILSEVELKIHFVRSNDFNESIIPLREAYGDDLCCNGELGWFDSQISATSVYINYDYYQMDGSNVQWLQMLIFITTMHELCHFFVHHVEVDGRTPSFVWGKKQEAGECWELQNLGGIVNHAARSKSPLLVEWLHTCTTTELKLQSLKIGNDESITELMCLMKSNPDIKHLCLNDINLSKNHFNIKEILDPLWHVSDGSSNHSIIIPKLMHLELSFQRLDNKYVSVLPSHAEDKLLNLTGIPFNSLQDHLGNLKRLTVLGLGISVSEEPLSPLHGQCLKKECKRLKHIGIHTIYQ